MKQIIAQHYEIMEKLGEGGMGDVYRGLDTRTQSMVAIKQLKPEITTPDMIERFSREGAALRDLNHPNIVKLLHSVEQNKTHYLIMEYVSGGDLANILDTIGKLPIDRILNIAIDLADALTRAHRLDIIHRDLKPANILISDDGTTRLTDFGVAHIGNKNSITEDSNIVGTLAYLSPEALSGEKINTRSDIWAFGVILYEMIAGQHPFMSDKVGQIVLQIINEPIPYLDELREDAPLALIDLVYRMLERDPHNRISSVRLIGAELESILQGHDLNAGVVSSSPRTIVESPRFQPTPVIYAMQKHNIPTQLTSFVGRDNELAELELMVNEARLVTILASGGMGKTRLALELASRYIHWNNQTHKHFDDGIYFIDLAPLTTSENIIFTLADTIGYPIQQDGRAPKQQILDYLHEKSLLLIMDNFEHVIGGADLVTDILKFAPEVIIIATSRTRLNQTGEVIFNLEGMDFPELDTLELALEYSAIKLFIQSAKRLRSNFDLVAEDVSSIIQICNLVYGVPLGIVLAASWIEMLTPKEIADQIASNLIDFLETEMTDIPERQRSVRAVFNYSWNLMKEAEQQAFMKLSIFRGGMTWQAAQQVADVNLHTLRSLTTKSLINRDVNSGRYVIHELLRQFAEEKLKNSGLYDTTRQAHALYFAQWLESMEADIKGRRQVAGLEDIAFDFDNVQNAWHWLVIAKDAVVLNQFIEGVYWYCILSNVVIQGAQLFHVARETFTTQDEKRARAIYGRLLVRFPPQNVDLLSVYKLGLEIARQEANQAEIAFCLQELGRYHVHTLMDFDTGYPIQNESLKIYQSNNYDFEVSRVLDEIAFSYAIKGAQDKRLQYAHQSLELRQKIGDKIGTADALMNIGASEWALGNFDIAEDLVEQSTEIVKITGSLYGIAMANIFLSMILIRRKKEADDDRIRTPAGDAIRLARELHHIHSKTISFYHLGTVEIVAGNYAKAIELFKDAKIINNDPFTATMIDLANLGALIGLGDFDEAILSWQKIRNDSMLETTVVYVVFLHILTIMIFIPQMDDIRAVENLSLIYHTRDKLFLPVHLFPFFLKLQNNLRQQIDIAAYELAWERGKLLQLHEVFTIIKDEFLE